MTRAVRHHDPGAMLAALLAITVHVALFTVLVFGVRWKTKHPDPVMAELWRQLPPVEAPRVEPPKPAPKPEPKVEPKSPPKPDIALEQERKRKEALERKKRDDEKRAKAEQERKAREEAAEKKRAEEERRLEAEATRRRMDEQLNRELAAAAPKSGAPLGDPKARAQWADRIRAKIRGNIVLPPDVAGNPEAVFDVQLLPTGEVLAAKLRKSSGVRAYDEAVERAILKSSPLPLPERREVFEARLELRFRPRD